MTGDAEAEVWRPVPEWPYQVTDRGQVRRATTAPGTRAGYVLKPAVLRGGHRRVTLYDGDRRTRRLVHHLVLEVFDRPCPPGMECLHGPGGPADNRWPENIRWGFPSENQGPDRVRDGTDNGGERNGHAKLTEADVREIRQRWAAGGVTQTQIAADYVVDNTQISRIVNGHTWQGVG